MTTEKREREEAPGLEAAAFRLLVQRGAEPGMAFRVEPSQPAGLFLGHAETCDIRLPDPLVSRRHLSLALEGSRLRIRDLGSKNGTTVNGVEVVEAVLSGGEMLGVGATSLLVERDQSPTRVALTPAVRFGRFYGQSAAMRRLYPLCERLSLSDVPVILEGETGTGKELLAEALHEAGPRASGPFVVFDCTLGPPSLVEATLFGHERGAFTGAVGSRKGVFEEANGGTLLIDEIGDLDLGLQAKLLRAIERSEVKRLGDSKWIKVDVRILAATRRDLDKEIQAGRFRDDLYYRLAVARILLPPLRKRHGDVTFLAEHFWSVIKPAPMPEDFRSQVEQYDWPGNVRELANAVAHRAALEEHADLAGLRRPSSVPAQVAPEAEPLYELPFTVARDRVLRDFEERYTERVLAKYAGNITRAAKASGIARRYFYAIRARLEARTQEGDES